eukprot:22823-Rhodomonas_salina.1
MINNKDYHGNVMCDNFEEHEMTVAAGLLKAELVMLRLYTGSETPFLYTHRVVLASCVVAIYGCYSVTNSLFVVSGHGVRAEPAIVRDVEACVRRRCASVVSALNAMLLCAGRRPMYKIYNTLLRDLLKFVSTYAPLCG